MRRKRRRRLVGCNRGVCGVDRGDSGLGLQKGEGGKGERKRRSQAREREEGRKRGVEPWEGERSFDKC